MTLTNLESIKSFLMLFRLDTTQTINDLAGHAPKPRPAHLADWLQRTFNILLRGLLTDIRHQLEDIILVQHLISRQNNRSSVMHRIRSKWYKHLPNVKLLLAGAGHVSLERLGGAIPASPFMAVRPT